MENQKNNISYSAQKSGWMVDDTAGVSNRVWRKPEILEENYCDTKDDPPAPLLPGSPDQAS